MLLCYAKRSDIKETDGKSAPWSGVTRAPVVDHARLTLFRRLLTCVPKLQLHSEELVCCVRIDHRPLCSCLRMVNFLGTYTQDTWRRYSASAKYSRIKKHFGAQIFFPLFFRTKFWEGRLLGLFFSFPTFFFLSFLICEGDWWRQKLNSSDWPMQKITKKPRNFPRNFLGCTEGRRTRRGASGNWKMRKRLWSWPARKAEGNFSAQFRMRLITSPASKRSRCGEVQRDNLYSQSVTHLIKTFLYLCRGKSRYYETFKAPRTQMTVSLQSRRFSGQWRYRMTANMMRWSNILLLKINTIDGEIEPSALCRCEKSNW